MTFAELVELIRKPMSIREAYEICGVVRKKTVVDRMLARAVIARPTTCNHDLESDEKTLKATMAPRYGWQCTVCGNEWYPENN